MGNDSSKQSAQALQFGGIYVQLDKNIYSPEETLTGTINLNLSQPYPGYKLVLILKGTEFAHWIYRKRKTRTVNGKTQSYYVNVTRKAQIETINEEYGVYTWEQSQGAIPAGQYCFPFAFRIPNKLPGSFYLQRGSTIASVRYLITGLIVPFDSKIPKIQHEKDLVIRENLYQQIQTQFASISKEVVSCCCCKKGSVNIKIQSEKNAYAPGETARIIAEIDNSQCSTNINSVKFELLQHVELQAKGGYKKKFTNSITSVNLGKISANAPKEIKEASLILPSSQEGQVIYDQEQDNIKYQPEGPTASLITPSVNGYLVKSNFGLRIYCDVDVTCPCSDVMPSSELPIQVFSVAFFQEPVPVVPMGWQPQQMPVFNFTVNMAPIPDEFQLIQYGNMNNGMNNYNMVDYNQVPQQGFQQYGENIYGHTPNQSQVQPINYYSNVEMINYNQPAQ